MTHNTTDLDADLRPLEGCAPWAAVGCAAICIAFVVIACVVWAAVAWL